MPDCEWDCERTGRHHCPTYRSYDNPDYEKNWAAWRKAEDKIRNKEKAIAALQDVLRVLSEVDYTLVPDDKFRIEAIISTVKDILENSL